MISWEQFLNIFHIAQIFSQNLFHIWHSMICLKGTLDSSQEYQRVAETVRQGKRHGSTQDQGEFKRQSEMLEWSKMCNVGRQILLHTTFEQCLIFEALPLNLQGTLSCLNIYNVIPGIV